MNFIKNNPGKIKVIIIFIIFSIFIVWQSSSWHSNDILVNGDKRIRLYDFEFNTNRVNFKVKNKTHREIMVKTVGFTGENEFWDREYTYVPASKQDEISTVCCLPAYTGTAYINVDVKAADSEEEYGNFSMAFEISDYEIISYTTGETLKVSEPVIEDFSSSSDFTLPHGTLLSSQINDDQLVIKAKITALSTNKTTIDQNYFNVENIIKNQGGDQYTEIQYWAVADMTSGEESKVISFTLDSSTIQMIKNGSIAATQIGDYANDLYILPSLM